MCNLSLPTFYSTTFYYHTLWVAIKHVQSIKDSNQLSVQCLRLFVYWKFYPVPDRSGDGVLLSIDFFVCLYVSFFVSLLARLRANGWSDLHELFRKGAEWPWENRIQLWVNSEKPHDAAMLISFTSFVNITSKRLDRFAWNFQGRCGVTMGGHDYILGQFRETATMRNTGTGFVVLSHHSLLLLV